MGHKRKAGLIGHNLCQFRGRRRGLMPLFPCPNPCVAINLSDRKFIRARSVPAGRLQIIRLINLTESRSMDEGGRVPLPRGDVDGEREPRSALEEVEVQLLRRLDAAPLR